ncbi:MAG: hypothetical protein Wins2KO_19080 [Winogradskyella sp.]
MKLLKGIIAIAIVGLVFTSCKNDAQPEVKTVDVEVNKEDVASSLDPNATYAKVEFGIEGMTCEMGCAKTIEKKMAKMEGVKSAKVDFDKRLAMVEYDEAKVSPKSLEETVTNVADVYKVKDMKLVEDFGTDKEKKPCSAECKKACAEKGDKDMSKKDCSAACKKACAKKEMKS